MGRVVRTAGLLLVGLVALTGCSSGDSTEPAATGVPTTTAGVAEVPVGQTFTDPTTGDVITVVGVVRGFAAPAGLASYGETVLVNATLAGGPDYYIPGGSSYFQLSRPGSEGFYDGPVDTAVESAMVEAGYPLFTTVSGGGLEPGGVQSGWIPIGISDADADGLVLDYARPEVSLTTGGTLPPYEQTVELPDPVR